MIITKTPLRISFLGGNTDFREYYLSHGGLVLSTTIDKYVYCIVKKRFDDLIIVNYTIKETVDSVDDLKHDLVREALKMVGIEKGIEISFFADIPSQGTGLGSSSAVTIGVLNALHTYLGENVSSWKLAEEAIKIELDILKNPIGVQDQLVIALGGLRLFELKQSGKIIGNKVLMDEHIKEDFNSSLMLIYTGVSRKSQDILSKFNVAQHKPLLDQNKQLAHDGAEKLLRGDLRAFGELLDLYWLTKQQLSDGITNEEIDDMYATATRAGAIGGKIIGAGGGGFMLVMFPANKRVKVRNSLRNYKELPFRFTNQGSKVIFNDD